MQLSEMRNLICRVARCKKVDNLTVEEVEGLKQVFEKAKTVYRVAAYKKTLAMVELKEAIDVLEGLK